MNKAPMPGQEALIPLEDLGVVAPAQPELRGNMAPLGDHWTVGDPREDRRAETLRETLGWSPELARIATTGVISGGAPVPEAAAPAVGLAHRDWTLEGRAEHLAGAARTRSFLRDQLGLEATRAARERND